MQNGDSDEKKKNFARVAHFSVHFFDVVFFHEYNVTLPSYKFCEGHVVCLPFTLFFSLPLIFTW